jgi:tRNA(Ile)-lysidine synthase
MLPLDTSLLADRKNLLAFSAGIDSSALFFLLIEHRIKFDIAIVDYGIRAQSNEEVAHAKALAKQYGLRCHVVTAPQWESHFEEQARAFRYNFFESLIQKEGYETLLTAHQLNDRLEWFLMRLGKGAGTVELAGMAPVVHKENYLLVRPLLDYSKEELLDYLKMNNYPYFVDESNHDETYERNYFRKHFSDPLLAEFKEGIKQSLHYLHKDKALIEGLYETIYAHKSLRILRLYSPYVKSRAADTTLKPFGYLLSNAERHAIDTQESLVVGRKWAVETTDVLLYIAPYLTTEMPKHFKEQCRIAKIPPKIRPYLYQENIDPDTLLSLDSNRHFA